MKLGYSKYDRFDRENDWSCPHTISDDDLPELAQKMPTFNDNVYRFASYYGLNNSGLRSIMDYFGHIDHTSGVAQKFIGCSFLLPFDHTIDNSYETAPYCGHYIHRKERRFVTFFESGDTPNGIKDYYDEEDFEGNFDLEYIEKLENESKFIKVWLMANDIQVITYSENDESSYHAPYYETEFYALVQTIAEETETFDIVEISEEVFDLLRRFH